MNKIRQNEGFTLIEVLVTINLSFIVLTILVTFFLFSYKFISTISKNIDSRSEAENFIYYTDRLFSKTNNIRLEINNESNAFITDKGDSILVKSDTLSLKDLFKINAESYSITSANKKGESNIIIYPGSERTTYFNKSFKDLNHIEMKFNYHNKEYNYSFLKPVNSTSNFKNIRRN